MKRALISGFLALISTLWAIALLAYANSNLVASWDGGSRLWATVKACGAAVPLLLSLILLACSLIFMIMELLKKD